jgi:hypothetical protein
MRGRGWWLKLQLWQFSNTLRARPIRHCLGLLLWFVLAIMLPAACALAGAPAADAALDWLLSLDMPLGLLLAAQVGSAIVALASRADTENWLLPPAARGWAGRMLFLARLMSAMRWSFGLVLAASLLYLGSTRSPERLLEQLTIVFFAIVGGASFAWLLLGRSRTPQQSLLARTTRERGWKALSWVPLAETLRRLDPRRLALLAVPVLVGAPMAAEAQLVMRWLAAWVVMIYIANWIQEAIRTAFAMRVWMPRALPGKRRHYWYIWRYVVLATLMGIAALWVGARATGTAAWPARP